MIKFNNKTLKCDEHTLQIKFLFRSYTVLSKKLKLLYTNLDYIKH